MSAMDVRLEQRRLQLGEPGDAAGPGVRPVIADNRVVQGQLLIMKVDCPQNLEAFQQFVDGLKFDGVASG